MSRTTKPAQGHKASQKPGWKSQCNKQGASRAKPPANGRQQQAKKGQKAA